MTAHTELSLNPQVAVPASRRWRRIRKNAVQFGIMACAVALIALFAAAMRDGLARNGIEFSFAYLWNIAGIDISEGKTVALVDGWPQIGAYSSGMTNTQALVAGLFNTLKVAILALVLSTIIGTLIGVGRLSTNWLVRRLCFGVVEFVRNTPLLIQLTFWYVAVVLKFPPMASAAKLFGGVIASQQGVFLPAIVGAPDAGVPAFATLLGSALCLAAAFAMMRNRPLRNLLLVVSAAAFLASLALGFPLAIDYPVATRFRASGGSAISPEMAALLLAITIHSSAYLAETVRGAIETIHRGQWEASASLGLSRGQTLKDIILPQVFRVVLPSFGNQYINLTKNTSLGIAIGYPDLFNVYGTIANQTGRSLEGMLVVMATYLLISWTISGAVNFANGRLTAQGATR